MVDIAEPGTNLDSNEELRRKPGWFARLILAQDSANSRVSEQLCDHLRRSLLTDFEALPRPGDDLAELAAIHDRAIAMLTPPGAPRADVDQAYKYRAHLTPDSTVGAALQREAAVADALAIDTTRLRESIARTGDDAMTTAETRQALIGLVEEVQWARKKNTASRDLRACYVKHVCWLTVPVALFFVFALMWTIWEGHPFNTPIDSVAAHLRYPGLIVMLLSGVLGAWFSMLVSIDTRLSGLKLDELRVAQRLISLISRLIFGGASALIFYFLLKSELIEATFLPKIDGIGFTQIAPPKGGEESLRERTMSGDFQLNWQVWLPTKNLCLLIVWGVICGFSEKLIPAALTRHADAAGDSPE